MVEIITVGTLVITVYPPEGVAQVLEPIGAPGTVGPAGPPGIGIPGEQGDDGDDGSPGQPGMPGAAGPAGRDGIGIPGEQGDDGDEGHPGPPGQPGAPGPAGAPGAQVMLILEGDDGEDGQMGPPGAASTVPGPAGAPGSQVMLILEGDDGEDGQMGPPGAASTVPGPAGPPGSQVMLILEGDDGEDGQMGPPGPVSTVPGPSGAPGLQTILRQDGSDGEDGGMGPPGLPGVAGPAGAPGLQTILVFDGDDGEDGSIGPPGIPGIQGPAGASNLTSSSVGFAADKVAQGGQAVTAQTLTKVTFGNEVFDLGPFYDVVNSKWTPPAGLVIITAGVGFSGGPYNSATAIIEIRKNGTAIRTERQTDNAFAGLNSSLSTAVVDNANGTDFYEIYASTPTLSSGSAFFAGDEETFFTGASVQGPIGPGGSAGLQTILRQDGNDGDDGGMGPPGLPGPAGPSGGGVTGQAVVDFGAFPGATDASVTITGQSGILLTSVVDAWLVAVATSDHSADEHVFESIKITAGNIVVGTGFTIYAVCMNQEPETAYALDSTGGSRLYGQWTVHWSWV